MVWDSIQRNFASIPHDSWIFLTINFSKREIICAKLLFIERSKLVKSHTHTSNIVEFQNIYSGTDNNGLFEFQCMCAQFVKKMYLKHEIVDWTNEPKAMWKDREKHRHTHIAGQTILLPSSYVMLFISSFYPQTNLIVLIIGGSSFLSIDRVEFVFPSLLFLLLDVLLYVFDHS